MEWKKVKTNFTPKGEHFNWKLLLNTAALEGAARDDIRAPKRLSKSGTLFETKDYDGELERLAAFALVTGLKPVKYKKVFFDLHVIAEDVRGEQRLYKINDWWYAYPIAKAIRIIS